ncbi:hypothetical protein BST61_g8599 [Cercospora zeina]
MPANEDSGGDVDDAPQSDEPEQHDGRLDSSKKTRPKREMAAGVYTLQSTTQFIQAPRTGLLTLIDVEMCTKRTADKEFQVYV